MQTIDILKAAVDAKAKLNLLSTDDKNRALLSMADYLEKGIDNILSENKKDIENAKGKINDVMIDRLMLNESRIKDMATGIRNVVKLDDPVGKTLSQNVTDDKLVVKKVSVPLGVVAIIYESRPNVTSDAAALCLKSGNVCVLRGGKEAYNSSHAIISEMKKGLAAEGFSEDFINILDDTTRQGAIDLMKAKNYVDLLIPRGGRNLIQSCVENADVPCIETGTGLCSIYVDESADLDMAVNIINNAKTQRPSVCNAEETCLINEKIADKFLPMLKAKLVDERIKENKVPVELRLCEKAIKIIDGTKATDEDFDTEFLNYILAIKVVKDVKEAVEHISTHSTHHSEAIITENKENADYFTLNVDSAALYVNASTRFTDGGMFGLGCEMGISTQKLHARGPMGLEELNCYKYIICGNGQIRE